MNRHQLALCCSSLTRKHCSIHTTTLTLHCTHCNILTATHTLQHALCNTYSNSDVVEVDPAPLTLTATRSLQHAHCKHCITHRNSDLGSGCGRGPHTKRIYYSIHSATRTLQHTCSNEHTAIRTLQHTATRACQHTCCNTPSNSDIVLAVAAPLR